MEIKTCEEYVLAQLDTYQRSLAFANNTIEYARTVLKLVSKYLKDDGHGNIIISEFSFDPVSHGRVLIMPEQDKSTLLLALSQIEKYGKLGYTED